MAMTKKEREHVERLEKLIEQQAATIEALLLNTPAPIVIQPVSCGCPCHWPHGATGYSCWCSCNRTITWSTGTTIDPTWDTNVTLSGNEITGQFNY